MDDRSSEPHAYLREIAPIIYRLRDGQLQLVTEKAEPFIDAIERDLKERPGETNPETNMLWVSLNKTYFSKLNRLVSGVLSHLGELTPPPIAAKDQYALTRALDEYRTATQHALEKLLTVQSQADVDELHYDLDMGTDAAHDAVREALRGFDDMAGEAGLAELFEWPPPKIRAQLDEIKQEGNAD